MTFDGRCCANCAHVKAYDGWIQCNLIPEQRSMIVDEDGRVRPDDFCLEHDFEEAL